MAVLEPINSAMTFQAQQIQPIKTSADTEVINADANKTQDSSVAFDPTTAKIQEVKDQDPNAKEDGESNSLFEQQREASQEQLKKALENMNKKMANAEAVYGIHEGTNRVTIKLVDKDTKETIKELPAEKTLDMIARVWEMAGILVDEKR